MPLPRAKIEAALKKKGFVKEETPHHRYYHHEVDGKRSGAYTYVSRGSSHRDYDDQLLVPMRKTLMLDSKKQLHDLIRCPMTADGYNEFLREKGIISGPPRSAPE
jgi:hypothetical protein